MADDYRITCRIIEQFSIDDNTIIDNARTLSPVSRKTLSARAPEGPLPAAAQWADWHVGLAEQHVKVLMIEVGATVCTRRQLFLIFAADC